MEVKVDDRWKPQPSNVLCVAHNFPFDFNFNSTFNSRQLNK